jgi:hypothetical protein
MPVATTPRGARAVSVVPSQGLFLLNSPMVLASAESLANTLGDDDGRIEQLYLRLLARKPSPAERQRAQRFVDGFASQLQQTGTTAGDARRAACVRLCHTLLIANEFLVVE